MRAETPRRAEVALRFAGGWPPGEQTLSIRYQGGSPGSRRTFAVGIKKSPRQADAQLYNAGRGRPTRAAGFRAGISRTAEACSRSARSCRRADGGMWNIAIARNKTTLSASIIGSSSRHRPGWLLLLFWGGW